MRDGIGLLAVAVTARDASDVRGLRYAISPDHRRPVLPERVAPSALVVAPSSPVTHR